MSRLGCSASAAATPTLSTPRTSGAVQTAEIAFGGTGIPVHLDARLRECDYGELNGRPAAELDAARRLRHLDEPFPGGQSYRHVVAATAAFLGDVATRHDGERVVVISHSANRWAIQHLLEGIPLEELVGQPFDWQEGWVYHLPSRTMAG